MWNVLTSRFGYNGSHEGDEESLGFRTKKGGHGPSSSTTSLDGFIANIKRKTIEEQREGKYVVYGIFINFRYKLSFVEECSLEIRLIVPFFRNTLGQVF